MEKTIREGSLKKWIVYIILISRIIILLIVKMFNDVGRLTPDEFHLLFFTLLPMSALYFVLTIKFIIISKRYIPGGGIITKTYFVLSFFPLILLHLTEFVLIYFKNAINSDNYELLYWWIAIIECILAAYAGFYLSDLFSHRTNPENTKTPN